MPSSAPGVVEEEEPRDSSEYRLRKQLLLLAALVVSVTYVAGLTPPGGVWQEDGPGVVAGGPVLRITHRRRFLSFYYCNSTALAASLVVIFLLLLKNPTRVQLAVLRLVMALDLLGLMGAYLAGSCRDRPATVYATALVLALSAYVGVHILQGLQHPPPPPVDRRDEEEDPRRLAESSSSVLKPKERCKVLLLLATFATALTYVAGLSPPGGFWDTMDDGRRGGNHGHGYYRRGHFRMSFYCNTTAFVASLFIIVLLLDRKLSARTARSFALHVFVLSALLGLLAAYDAGSCRDSKCSVYVVSLFGAVLAFIFLTMVAISSLKGLCADAPAPESNNNRVHDNHATSMATSSSQGSAAAGLDPPGGFWPDDGEGHRAGDAILLSRDPARYKAFFYCNSGAFVVSLVVILMVQNVRLVRSHTLLVAMMLDMFALIGA
ncbi:uncharacterized protein C2845_PM13G10730 [Panicum miliaceum]|uniref:PGG domain-containing protein n=1 Tax=Panicum miliaceum TaxID=4540 RepID=A0A3L6RHU6_PANMI|nr:uncharacterized protein C2845_PM13G10730 [Panicum miliaceum]